MGRIAAYSRIPSSEKISAATTTRSALTPSPADRACRFVVAGSWRNLSYARGKAARRSQHRTIEVKLNGPFIESLLRHFASPGLPSILLSSNHRAIFPQRPGCLLAGHHASSAASRILSVSACARLGPKYPTTNVNAERSTSRYVGTSRYSNSSHHDQHHCLSMAALSRLRKVTWDWLAVLHSLPFVRR